VIDFDEAKHIYTIDGRAVPSVTDICSPITADHYGSINSAVLEMASRRGTAVHEATELIDLGSMPDDGPEIDGYINAYLDFLLDYQPKWEYIEWVGHYKGEYDGLEFCGTVDRAGHVGDEFWVLDIKTTASPTKENYIATCCQTMAYAMILEAARSCDRKILYLKKDGSYRLVDCDEKEAELGLDSYYLFSRLCAARNYIDILKERKKSNGKKKTDKSSDPAERDSGQIE